MGTLKAFRGLALTAMSSVLIVVFSSCGVQQGTLESPKALQKIGTLEGKVKILAWPGYVEDGSNDPKVDWVSAFEKDTGCQVTAKSYGTSDEALNLMKNGDYDVVAASGDATLRLIASKDVSPVNTDLVSNYAGIYDFLKNRSWNSVDGVSYGIPHGYGANLLMYNTDVIKPAPTSWDVVFDKAQEYSGKITAYDSPIYIADAAMYLMSKNPELGIKNPYALDEKQLAAAITLLSEQKKHISEYWSDYLKEIQGFESGSTVVGTTWQVIRNSLKPGTKAEVTLPKEGVTGWSDTWMVASKAKNPNCAYKWLNYISSPKVNAQVSEYFGESPSSQKACDFTENPDHCSSYHSGDEEYASKIWYWTTPVSKCIDGRKGVKCTDYAEWTTAWQQMKG